MLCAVVSSARWWATRPRRAVCSPKKAETDIALGLQVQHAQRGGRRRGRGHDGPAGGRGRAVAGLGVGGGKAREVVVEGELVAHEGAGGGALWGGVDARAAHGVVGPD